VLQGDLFQKFISYGGCRREVYYHIHFGNFALPNDFDCEV